MSKPEGRIDYQAALLVDYISASLRSPNPKDVFQELAMHFGLSIAMGSLPLEGSNPIKKWPNPQNIRWAEGNKAITKWLSEKQKSQARRDEPKGNNSKRLASTSDDYKPLTSTSDLRRTSSVSGSSTSSNNI